MVMRKPAPVQRRTCEYCLHKISDFFEDTKHGTTRCMCRARHVEVDVLLMPGCDFFTHNPEYTPPDIKKVIKPKRLTTKKPKRRK